jgi:hypothetical protein
MARAKKTQEFPDEIFVVREMDGDEGYLVTHETMDGIENNETVAIYQRVSIGRVKVTREVV